MTALYDVGQQKTTECGAGLSLTKSFRLLMNCAVVEFVGGDGVVWPGVLGRRISAGGGRVGPYAVRWSMETRCPPCLAAP